MSVAVGTVLLVVMRRMGAGRKTEIALAAG
jgi:hypothetical protein